jgi:hypothetical protein
VICVQETFLSSYLISSKILIQVNTGSLIHIFIATAVMPQSSSQLTEIHHSLQVPCISLRAIAATNAYVDTSK